MPMPREEDDDLFPTAADVDFIDGDEKPKKKTVKKKVAKKRAAEPKSLEKNAPKKKAATKKVAKKKPLPVADFDDVPRVKPARTKRATKGAPPKATKRSGGFGAGLFDDRPIEEDPLATPAAERPAPAPVEAESVYAYRSDDDRPDYRSEVELAPAGDDRSTSDDRPTSSEDGPTDEYGRPKPQANYVVHVYELGRFKRTIDRPFTPEAAEAFATEFSRTSKRYGRKAIAGKKDTQPAKESN